MCFCPTVEIPGQAFSKVLLKYVPSWPCFDKEPVSTSEIAW